MSFGWGNSQLVVSVDEQLRQRGEVRDQAGVG